MTPDSVETHDLPIEGITSIEAATFNGNITVEMGAERARLEVTLKGKATYKLEKLGKLLYIVVKKKGWTYANGGASLRLWLPSNLRLKLATVGGTLHVNGSTPLLEASTVNGAIESHNTGSGELRLSTVNGAVHVHGASGQLKASTVNGDLTIEMVSGQIDLSALSSVVQVKHARGRIQIGTANGAIQMADITFDPGEQSWVKTGFGPVTITDIQAPGGLQLSARTHANLIVTDLPGFKVHTSRDHLRATLPGDHPAHCEIVTTSTISLAVRRLA